MPLLSDFDLELSDIQAASGRDGIAGLFGALGYNTDARLTQTADAMGLTAESLKREIKHIERIADHEAGAFQVYLAELKSVTVANTQALARGLRNRAGNFLWILTSDYERIDFVLMEPMLPTLQVQSGITLKGAFLRPRVLTVDRRDPSLVDLRVLRRFSYTEADADYQFQKLKSAYTIAEWSERFFNNRALFADYYLSQRLKDAPEWTDPTLAAALRKFQTLFADVRQRVGGKAEAVARAELLEPALKALGFTLKAPNRDNSKEVQPDFYLLSGTDQSKPIAYCDAYVWDRILDGRDEQRDPDTPDENPGALVVSLLQRDYAPDWAIVTNGKTWRLYSKRAHSRATNYYEIDLEETVASPDPGFAFRYFWLLFRAAAFVPLATGPISERERGDAGPQQSFLDRLLSDSALYAKQLGERLKDRIFEDVFPEFAAGFIAHIRAQEGPKAELSDERLGQVFQGTLAFLYRLLFLLYAEARDLLPVREVRGYYDLSLTKLRKETADCAGDILDDAKGKLEKAYGATNSDFYERLTRLFALVDAGDADLNVPMYNGGLFITRPDLPDETPEAANARFLAANRIPDRFLATGLDRMARDLDDKTQALVPIDYKSLGVRQLGSIYEGLLEFKLRIAPEKMAVVKGKKTEEVIPFREAGERRIHATLSKGAPYLENDRRERKATGSYYTPDYIVKYIVENTLGPVLAEKVEALRPRLREAQKAYREAVKRREAFQKQRMKGDDPEKVASTFQSVVDDLFDVRVVDPAMGSGHFLVEAVDFITDRMLDFLNSFPWNPVTAELRRTRETILSEMDRQGVTIDPTRLTDVNLLKRHVLKRCIYGVDLNPMAVELAKVSLWLDCFTLGAPLSFLDHHLKCGNSLIGARVDEIRTAVEFKQEEQMSLFASSQFTGIMLATDLMRHVGELSDVTAEQVRASRAEFRRAYDALAPYRRIMDVYVSRWFGNEATKAQSKVGLEPTIEFLRRADAKAWLENPEKGARRLPPEMMKLGEAALNAAAGKRFFHWELEFPEVFFGAVAGTVQAIGPKEKGGFDAVVGNPPYDELSEDALGREIPEREFLSASASYRAAQDSGGRSNWYHFFMLLGVYLLRDLGRSGLIVPMSWIGDTFTSSVRRWLLDNHRPVLIECFPQKDDPRRRVFEDAKLPTSVYVLQRNRNQGEILVRTHPGRHILDVPSYAVEVEILDKLNREIALIPITSKAGWEILKKLATSDKLGPLGEFAAQPTSGEIIFNEETRPYMTDDDSYDIILRGGHIQRYELLDSARQGTPIYLKTKEYLAASRNNSKAFDHKEPRIVYQEGSAIDAWRRVVPTYLPAGYICGHKVCYFVGYKAEPLCLLAVFASGLTNWLVESLSATNSLPAYLISNLPYPRTDFTTPVKKRVGLVKDAIAWGNEWVEGAELASSVSFREFSATGMGRWVTARLAAQPEEADAVHDLLAHLAGKLIEMNKQKQAEMKRFLGWMEGLLKVSPDKDRNTGIDALTGKSKLRDYLGDYQKGEDTLPLEVLLDILHKNRNRLGVSISDAKFTARLKAEYEKSLNLLRPLKDRLARTDRLIDLVVYQLYGLTEEEVAVVEGKA